MFLSGGMQPDKAAITLIRVEEEWQSFAKSSVECHAKDVNFQNCQQAKSSFGKSCGTVLDAIVQGSSGDQNKVKTYMDNVCAEPALQGWHQKLCATLEDGLDKVMMFNANDNRMRFHSAAICDSLWLEFVDDEQKRVAQEREVVKEQLLKANAEAEARAKEKQTQEEALAKNRQQEEGQRLEQQAEIKAATAKKNEEERLAQEKKEKEEKEKEARTKENAKKEELRLALETAEEAQEKARKAAAEAAALTAQQEEKKAVAKQVADAEAPHHQQQSVSGSSNATQVATKNRIIKDEAKVVKTESKITNAIVSLPNSSHSFASFGHSLPQPTQDGKIIKSEGKLVKVAFSLNASAKISLPSNASQKQ